MAAPDRLYVDTNVFIRLFEGNDALAAMLGELFLLEPKGTRPFLATSELTLAELLVVPYREGDDQRIDRYDNWTLSNPYLEVGPVDRAVLWYAAVLRADYPSIKLPDAIHLSTAIGMECSHFLTADKRLGGTYKLTNRRYGIIKGPATIDIVRPDIMFLEPLVGTAR